MTRALAQWSFIAAFACTLALAPRAHGAGEITGRVTGYVFDPTGATVYGVTLTIHGSALIQPMTRQSNESGRFEFDNLPPGESYVIEGLLEGFAPIRQKGIKVLLGQTTSLDVHLVLPSETSQETYEIVAKANPLVNPESAKTGAVLGAEKAAETPVFTQVQGIPQLVAGVGPGTKPSSRGGLTRYGQFYVDGMDTTDITDGSFTVNMNFFAVENFEVITGGLDAEYNSMGLVENVVTKTGSNRWTYDFVLTLSPDFMVAKNKIPSGQLSYVGPYTNNTSASPSTSFYSPVLAVGGPIVRDRLWFYASAQLNLSSIEVPIITPVSPLENRPRNTTTGITRFKITYQPTARDRLSLALNWDYNTITNNITNQTVTDQAEQHIGRTGYSAILNYDRYFTDTFYFQLQSGAIYKNVDTDPQSFDYMTVSHADRDTRFTQFNGGNWVHEDKLRFQFDPSLHWTWGAHQMKGGVQLSYLGDLQTTAVPGGLRYRDKNSGVCDPANPATFNFCDQRTAFYNSAGDSAPLTTTASAIILGTFLQDRWNVSRKLTLVPGFRVDTGRLYGDGGNLVTTLVGYGPRFSATYDVMGDRRSLLVAHYGRSNDLGNINIAQHANPSLTQETSTFNGSAFPDCTVGSTMAGCRTVGGPTGRIFKPDQSPPTVDEISVGYHRETAPDTVLGIDLTYRYYGHLWADEEINRIWDPSGTAIVGYVDGMPHSVLQTETPDSAYRHYGGMDLWAQGTHGPWEILGSYTLSYTYGTVADYFDGYLNNPRFSQFFLGWLPEDRRHTLKGSLDYMTQFGLDIGTRFDYRTGGALWQNFSNPVDGSLYRSPRGTGFANNPATGLPDFNDPTSWVELRNPSLLLISVQARYNIGPVLHLSQRLELIALVVNLFNNIDPDSLYDQYAARLNPFGQALSRTGAMQGELLLRFRN